MDQGGGLPRQRVSHYRILGRLGAGGMGEVYSAFDETLKRRVALKAIRAENRLNEESKARFLREARLLSQLDHPHVCRAYDYIEEGDAEWLVLELVEGRDLRAALNAGLDDASRFRVAEQMASVLVAAHAAGVVHRDLKPGNVMLTGRGDVKVLDFGLAHVVDVGRELPHAALERQVQALDLNTDVDATQSLQVVQVRQSGSAASDASVFHTSHGAISGTVAYMSPEQAVGSPATTASDMYSFGLLLQELFTGRRPYDDRLSNAELLDRAQHGQSVEPDGLSGDLATLIRRLKSFAPSQRPTAIDTLERLRWIREKPARRLRWLAAAALLIVAILSAVKYTIDLARERTVAVTARTEADRRRDQAETLIGFLLGDLRRKLEPVGRLDILDDVGARAMEYFAAVPESSLTDEELLRRSKALYQIGEVRIAQGNLEAALGPLDESLQLARALAERKPDDGDRIFEVAQSQYWVGFVHWRRRSLDAAEQHFTAYLDAANRLAVLGPDRRDWRQEVSYANSNLGSVLEARGDLDGALDRFRASLAIEEGLLADAPADGELLRSVASSHDAIGAVLRARGDLAGATEEYAAELAIIEQLASREPDNATWQVRLAVSLSRMGDMHAAMGDRAGAVASFARAVSIADALVDRDDQNRTWRRELARNEMKMSSALRAADAASAYEHALRAVRAFETLTATDASNAGWQRDHAEARHALGLSLLTRGDVTGAEREARAVLAMTTALQGSPSANPDDRRLESLGHGLRGRALQARGASAEAGAAWERARAAIEPLARESRDYVMLVPWAEALRALGRPGDLAIVVDLLREMGYKPSL